VTGDGDEQRGVRGDVHVSTTLLIGMLATPIGGARPRRTPLNRAELATVEGK